LNDQKCPVCDGLPIKYSIETANIGFLKTCAEKKIINEAISLLRIIWTNFPDLRQSISSQMVSDDVSAKVLRTLQLQLNEAFKPTMMLVEKFPEFFSRLPSELDKSIDDKIKAIKTSLTKEFRDTLSSMGFPEPEQLKVLGCLIPIVVPLLQELLMLQKVPSKKGKTGELELLAELRDHFPEDDYESIGGPGDTDIVATPRYGEFQLEQKILIESKKNDSGWRRTFLENIRKHMKARSNQFAILAVEIMPEGAKGFLVEHSDEGAVLVTSRKDISVTYAALKSVLIATSPFKANVVDIRRLLEEKRIEEAVRDALHYQEYLRRIRVKTARIISDARSVVENSDELDLHLKTCLRELQNRIRETVEEVSQAKVSVQVKRD